MSNSILTNTSAMTALQTLNATNKSLDATQERISTGMRVSGAEDNAAYWSIATTMRSDNGALSAVQDALGLGAATVDTMYTALNSTVDVVPKSRRNWLLPSSLVLTAAKSSPISPNFRNS